MAAFLASSLPAPFSWVAFFRALAASFRRSFWFLYSLLSTPICCFWAFRALESPVVWALHFFSPLPMPLAPATAAFISARMAATLLVAAFIPLEKLASSRVRIVLISRSATVFHLVIAVC